MRYMRGRYGIILLDGTEVIFRIYEISDREWRLFHYHSAIIEPSTEHRIQASDIMEIIGDFFATDYAQHIAEWRIGSRDLSTKLISELAHALDIRIENLSLHREQELLCKGIFTELW